MTGTTLNMNEAVGRDTMTPAQAAAWNAMRSMSCGMDIDDLRKEIQSAERHGDEFRARCFRVLLAGAIEENE